VAKQNLDQHLKFVISPAEAATGGEKQVIYKRGGRQKRLIVKIPAGIKTGTKIRIKNMGQIKGKESGDLYLHVQVRG
jgi:DnaJ-class molecular chaperone